MNRGPASKILTRYVLRDVPIRAAITQRFSFFNLLSKQKGRRFSLEEAPPFRENHCAFMNTARPNLPCSGRVESQY
jgi:hypothetical protein